MKIKEDTVTLYMEHMEHYKGSKSYKGCYHDGYYYTSTGTYSFRENTKLEITGEGIFEQLY